MAGKTRDCDVAVIGAGPTGLMTALKLGQAGVRVCVLEKRAAPFSEPRAIAYDAELLRHFQTTGTYDDINPSMIHDLPVKYFNEKGKLLWAFGHCPRAFGFPSRGTYYQPALEQGLVNALGKLENVELHRGVDITGFDQDETGVTLELAGGTVRATYAVACDGGSSPIRQALGLKFSGKTFMQKWLVIDTTGDKIENSDLQFFCSPKRPALTLPNAGNRRRWEFLVMPGDNEAELATEKSARKLIADHGGGTGFGIERSLIYTFHARYAERFRVGRILIAGDAAHVMPPFAGQGLTSGVRDAVNLGWKLSGVCKGVFPASILDSYEMERRPHIEKVTNFAVQLGGVIMTTSPVGAWFRDRVMNLIWSFPPTRNFIDKNDPIPPYDLRASPLVNRRSHRKAGLLIEQPNIVSKDNGQMPLDAAMGRGFALVGIGIDAHNALGVNDTCRLEALGTRFVSVNAGRESYGDSENFLSNWLGQKDALILVRPDRIVADVLQAGADDNRLAWMDSAYGIDLAATATL